jgi:phosphonate transport system ATP-binding protein
VTQAHGVRPLVEIRNLAKAYGSAEPAINDISLSFRSGEFIVLLGPSGVGKSTLLRCMNFLVRPTIGQVIFDGQDLGALTSKQLLTVRQRIGMIFQEFHLVNRMSVLSNVMCGRLGSLNVFRALTFTFSKEDHIRAVRALMRVGLEDPELYLRRADTLSGGQKQRVAIARMLVQEPKLILADEPIASLDIIMREQIMDLIVEIARRDGIAVVMSLHQIDVARKYADRIVGLSQGKVIFDGAPKQLSDNVVETIFRKKKLEVVNSNETVASVAQP